MRLHTIRIQNYKSLQDVTLTDLQPVNLFIGANNSGKSNVLKALKWVKECLENDNMIDLPLDATFNKDKNLHRHFHLVFENEEGNFFHLKTSKEETARFLAAGDAKEKTILKTYTERSKNSFGAVYNQYDFREDRVKEAAKFLPDITIYSIVPSTFSQPTKYTYTTKVNEDASNLVSFLDVMRDHYPLIFSQIIKDLTDCVPTFKEFTMPKINNDGTLQTIRFFDANNVSYPASEVSEGVLYFLALLCIVHQPEPPQLLLLEEPEKGVHPRRIKEVMNYIFTLAEQKNIQILMTTHSPFVVDEFKDLEECIYVFDRDGEATTVKNLQRDVIDGFNKRAKSNGTKFDLSQSLGDNWTTGLLGGVPKS
jgi:predicted ATPase